MKNVINEEKYDQWTFSCNNQGSLCKYLSK